MLRRRLTALLTSLLLLPSIYGGGDGCVMSGVVPAQAHEAGHGAHHADASVASHEPATDSPAGVPHAPAECVVATGCSAVLVVAAMTSIENPAHVDGRVEADAALAPDSPTPGLEPPPPRA